MNDMKNHLPLRIWLIVSITLLISAIIVRLAWATTYAPSAGYLFVVLTILLVTLGIYALFLYFTIKPSLKKLKSLPVRIWITIIITGGLRSEHPVHLQRWFVCHRQRHQHGLASCDRDGGAVHCL